jgi:hypothetical protein
VHDAIHIIGSAPEAVGIVEIARRHLGAELLRERNGLRPGSGADRLVARAELAHHETARHAGSTCHQDHVGLLP